MTRDNGCNHRSGGLLTRPDDRNGRGPYLFWNGLASGVEVGEGVLDPQVVLHLHAALASHLLGPVGP